MALRSARSPDRFPGREALGGAGPQFRSLSLPNLQNLSLSLMLLSFSLPRPHCVQGSQGSENRREVIVPSFSPELIQIMRAALDEMMTRIPLDQATPSVKAAMAECILKAAANGQTSYDGLIAAASEQIQTILSMLL